MDYRIPTINEIIEENREKEIRRMELEAEEHREKVQPKDLAVANRLIKEWKQRYSRKNGRNQARIRTVATSYMLKDGGIKFNYMLQLFVNNNLKEEINIMHEAYDVVIRNSIDTSLHPPHEFHTIFQFEPANWPNN